MKERKKNAHSDDGASERAKEPGQASRQGLVSTHNDTTSPLPGQAADTTEEAADIGG